MPLSNSCFPLHFKLVLGSHRKKLHIFPPESMEPIFVISLKSCNLICMFIDYKVTWDIKNTNIQFLPLFSSKAYEFEKSTRKLEIYQFSLSLINQSVSTVIIIITYSYKINNLKLKFLNKNLSKSLHFKVFPKENTFKKIHNIKYQKENLTLSHNFIKIFIKFQFSSFQNT